MNTQSRDEKIPDASVWVSEEFGVVDAETAEIPFLVVESAVSQTRNDLMDKLNEWKNKGIVFVMGIDRKESKKEVDFITFIEGEEKPRKTFKFGEIGKFDFHLKKTSITKGYNLQPFELNPNSNEIHIYLDEFLII